MTISYRTITLLVIAVIVLLIGIRYFQGELSGSIASVRDFAAEKTGLSFGSSSHKPASSGAQQARFTNLDGSVRVKKSNSNTWVSADYGLPLEKGDYVQTLEGMAKVVFGDGTNYTIKPESLIVVEDNSSNAAQQTQVAVQVTNGTVDLATGTYVTGSKSQVSLAGATASFAPESAAMVRNNPREDQHEILLKKGAGEVVRNQETVVLSEYERVSFKADAPQMTTQKEMGPPTLITPAAAAPVYVNGSRNGSLDLNWSPVPNSHGYRVRISANALFTAPVFDKVIPGTETKVSGLKDGRYFWSVSSLDEGGRESVESEHNQFTVITRRGPESASLLLEVQPFIRHGRVLEIKGRTEPNARVIVNGQEVPMMGSDGVFSFFTSPLPSGQNVITITAQNAKGGVKTKQETVTID